MSTRATIRKVLAGDVDAYGEIIRDYQDDVTKVVAAMLFDRQESADLIQQTFLDAYEKLDRFDLDRDFALWLKGIARNTVRMHLRKHRTRYKYMELYRERLLAEDSSPERELIMEDRAKALHECLSILPDNSRELMQLRYDQDMNIDAISDDLGRTVAAVTKSLSRIRQGLRECIEERLSLA